MSSINELSEQLNIPLEIPTETLIEREEIKGTPFTITSMNKQKHFLSLANIKLSDTYNTKEEVAVYYAQNIANVVMTAATTLMQMQIDAALVHKLTQLELSNGIYAGNDHRDGAHIQ